MSQDQSSQLPDRASCATDGVSYLVYRAPYPPHHESYFGCETSYRRYQMSSLGCGAWYFSYEASYSGIDAMDPEIRSFDAQLRCVVSRVRRVIARRRRFDAGDPFNGSRSITLRSGASVHGSASMTHRGRITALRPQSSTRGFGCLANNSGRRRRRHSHAVLCRMGDTVTGAAPSAHSAPTETSEEPVVPLPRSVTQALALPLRPVAL